MLPLFFCYSLRGGSINQHLFKRVTGEELSSPDILTLDWEGQP